MCLSRALTQRPSHTGRNNLLLVQCFWGGCGQEGLVASVVRCQKRRVLSHPPSTTPFQAVKVRAKNKKATHWAVGTPYGSSVGTTRLC